MKRSIGNLQIGDAVKVISTGFLAARQYIGQTGKLVHVARTFDGKAVGYDVEFPDDLIRASAIEVMQEVQP
jgi:hypothetical protein